MNHIEQDNSRFHPPIWFTDYDEAKRLAQAMPTPLHPKKFISCLKELNLLDSGLAVVTVNSAYLVNHFSWRLKNFPYFKESFGQTNLHIWEKQFPDKNPKTKYLFIVSTGHRLYETQAYVHFVQSPIENKPEEANPLQPRLL